MDNYTMGYRHQNTFLRCHDGRGIRLVRSTKRACHNSSVACSFCCFASWHKRRRKGADRNSNKGLLGASAPWLLRMIWSRSIVTKLLPRSTKLSREQGRLRRLRRWVAFSGNAPMFAKSTILTTLIGYTISRTSVSNGWCIGVTAMLVVYVLQWCPILLRWITEHFGASGTGFSCP